MAQRQQQQRQRRAFLIDTDTASDDAVALVMALRCAEVDVKAITVVAGNVNVGQATRNALFTVELCGMAGEVPVYRGADRPLVRAHEHAEWFHGRDGLGDRGFAPRNAQPQAGDAVEAIIRVIRENPGITLVTLGPLTNIALAVAREPGIVGNVSRCVVMGGNPCCEGNVTPAAEYNMWVDPEAARRVFHAGLPIEMVGWNLCRGEANLLSADIERVRAMGTEVASFCIDCNAVAMEANRRQSGEVGIALPDPTAMAIAIEPGIATRVSEHLVEIETQSELTRGQTVVDRLNVARDARNRGVWTELAEGGKGNARVVWTMDILRWKGLLFELIAEERK